MSSTVLTEELARAILKAMGCPLSLCTSVSLDMEPGELASITLRYHLDPAWLEDAADTLAREAKP